MVVFLEGSCPMGSCPGGSCPESSYPKEYTLFSLGYLSCYHFVSISMHISHCESGR